MSVDIPLWIVNNNNYCVYVRVYIDVDLMNSGYE